ncbi:LysE family translocator [Pseudooceanicola sediminis]|uniref:LysE family translocator n=1 Tax=Pseudooceanicola sediminis TaxID=2211117 RepID=A0A399IZF7_9RHOB|nr:LysE family translocator [Pseudooceanicola sediminis]KAA2313624.1 LysE family translocator [Puniceibacterium sp. HSS470]RII38533.1 LysE family translocator [Pseudooceanicola sediminis]|tara:strand:- start:17084 stop:17719 length:636 start_codon:yes stop_codon:yes gene_type:complete
MDDFAFYLPRFVAAFSILTFAAVSPGPAVAFLLGVSASRGRGAALIATSGIALGSSTINVLTLLGVGLLLSQIAWAMELLRLIGAAYLLWMAYGALRKAIHPPRIEAAPLEPASAHRLFAAGYLMQVTNPKAIAFWLAIASVGATQGGGPLVVAAFIACSFVISFTCHAAWALVLSAAPVRAAYARGRRWIEGALGAFFCFAAWKIAVSES